MLRFIFRIIYILSVLYETLLGIRFLFKMIHISATVPVAGWIYSHTNFFINLFSGANVPNYEILGFFVESTTLIAITVITIINWALAEIIKVLK